MQKRVRLSNSFFLALALQFLSVAVAGLERFATGTGTGDGKTAAFRPRARVARGLLIRKSDGAARLAPARRAL